MTDRKLKKILNGSVSYESAAAEKTSKLLIENLNLKNKYRFTFVRRLKNVISYISPLFWCIQSVFLLIFIFIDYEKFSILPVIPIVAVTALCEILKSAYFEMWELERTCKYDLRSLLITKLLITGTVDFILVIIAVISGGSEIYGLLYSACIYILTCVLCLTAFKFFRNKSLVYVFSVIGLILSLTVYVLLNFQRFDIFSLQYIHLWCMCFIVFLILYFMRIKRILGAEGVYER
ncbi:MAG: hypothetical protein IKL10_09015 [Clostridia bacterium]|nr:hypothetical protein [Clostridia bacterium]